MGNHKILQLSKPILGIMNNAGNITILDFKLYYSVWKCGHLHIEDSNRLLSLISHISCMNISSKWIKVLNVKLETLKLLEAKIGKKLLYEHRWGCLNSVRIAQDLRPIIIKGNFMKSKNFLFSKERWGRD